MKTYTDKYGQETAKTTIYIPIEQQEALVRLSRNQHRKMSGLVTMIIGDYLRERGILTEETREKVSA